MKVTLVRHAMPSPSPAAAPRLWPLSEEGRRDAERLRSRVRDDHRLWLSSEEREAVETLECLCPHTIRRVAQDARFNEVVRVEPFDDAFRSRRRAWVEGELDERHVGWESPQMAGARFDEGIREYGRKSSELVVGSHGMVMTAWLVHVGLLTTGVAAGDRWESLSFPDIVEVDLN